MAAQSNGRAKKPKKTTQSNHMNGHQNGHIEKSTVSSPAVRSSNTRRTQKTFLGSLTNLVGRLLSWYLIITVLIRCPSSLTQISDESPRVCKPYLQARSYAVPYLDPYYQTYVAPQVEKVKPYVDRFDQQIYSPVSAFTKVQYATYGAHRVEQAKQYAEAEWDKTVRPQLQKAQVLAKEQYDVHLGPHVKKASDTATPYYDQTKDRLVNIYHLRILPAYEAALPYSRQAYAHGHHAVSHIIFPQVQSARDAGWAFITRTLWPQLRILYGDNVEPQLVRIRERLGRYRDQQKIESVVDALESETPVVSEATKLTPFVASPSTTVSSSKAGWGVLDDFFGADSSSTTSSESETKTATRPAVPQLTGAELREKLNEDLRQWQSKFATAADKGAEDLEQRVAEITERQVENSVKGHGAALVIQLEETAKSTIARFKDFINQIVKDTPEDATEQDLESAYEQSVAKTRELGLKVKEKAQAVRTWKATYDQETDSLVQAAVKSTVDVLEKIHGLGLQEVGMRWAWTDGVQYKDWQKYHKLRSTLTEWQAEVEAVGSRHDGLRIAHEEAKILEDKAMSIAAEMVGELVRLKDVSRWKIWASDFTDDFSDRKVPPRVFKGAREVVENVEHVASKASEAVLGSETPLSESIASAVHESISVASSKISQSAVGSETPAAESIASEANSKVSDAYSEASEAIAGSESNAQSPSSHTKEAVETSVEEGEDIVQEVVSSVSSTPKKVLGGAMAQVLAEAKQIIFEDVIDDDDESETYSQKVQEIVAEAGDRAAEVSRAVSEALLGPAKTQGTVESVSSLASEQYEKALAAASSALYGTDKQPIESATSIAAEKFAAAVTAASYAVYGTPTPTAIIKTIQVHASSRYSEAISLANEQLANAKAQLSALVSGTPKPAHETLLSLVENAYSDSVAAASERLHIALHYTDSVRNYVAGPTQGYFESVSSIAASRLSDGLSHASAHFSAQPTPALEGARRQYYEAVGLAHARYSEFLGAASSALYGPEQGSIESLASAASESAASIASQAEETAESLASQASSSVVGSETLWTESVASQASHNWESLIAKASSQVYGAPTPWAKSVYSQAGAYGAQATAQAAAQYAAVQALVSELIVGKEPDFTESVLARFSSAYYTAVPDVVSSVNSYANEHYEAASSYASESYESATEYVGGAYESASSVINSIFTPPPAIETILGQASEQLNQAVESASAAVYGTQQAQDQFAAVAASAQAAISEAIFGTPSTTGYAASVTSGAGDAYSSISSVASEKAANAASAISSAIYGPEQGAVESASNRLAAAVEAANSQINAFYADAAKSAEEAVSSVSSVVTEATQRVKDEL